ncbi:MAG TPA: WYL domain-containing protein [Actinomycetota bacterium]|nr:WYL domain-containing protein [Actinomycetota bacterium]
MPPGRTAERLRRLLALVPYVVRNPGTSVAELAELFGTTREALTSDLNLLLFTGLPPYSPGDLIEVEIEEGRVWIRMADYFSRPLRLTRAEALSLYLRGAELSGAPGLEEAQALRSALEKLRDALGPETLGELTAEVEGEDADGAGPLPAIRAAVAARERIEIDHYSIGRDELTTRRIDPEEVFPALGRWYVVAWCHMVDGERLFRVDRIREARPTGERFEPRGLLGQGRPLYSPSQQDRMVRLRLGPRARWVAEYYATDDEREVDGRLEISLPTKDLGWVAKLVLRLGGDVEVAEPPELGQLARDVAQATLALYR